MSTFDHADRVHRLVKEALDRGTVGSLEEAEALFQRYRLVLEIGATEAANAGHQATLLTAVALGRRVFLGGVLVRLGADAPLLVPLPLAPTLRDAIVELGGCLSDETVPDELPIIVIGGSPRPRDVPFKIRTLARGWRGGIVPAESARHDGEEPMPLAAMLAAAFAISEAFLYIRGENAAAGYRSVGLSLWNPHPDVDWLAPSSNEPKIGRAHV